MSELKVVRVLGAPERYDKSEVDKVIADLEESHKKEVEQLLMEIVGLKNKLQNVSELVNETREWLIESQKLHKKCADNAVKIIRHNKYKRCLARAQHCYDKWLETEGNKSGWWRHWQLVWLKLAENFKEEGWMD